MKKTLFFALLWGGLQLTAQSKLSVSTSLFLNELSAAKGSVATLNSTDHSTKLSEEEKKRLGIETIKGKECINAILLVTSPEAIGELTTLGVFVGSYSNGVLTAQIPLELLKDVETLSSVSLIEKATLAEKRLDLANIDSKVNKVNAGLSNALPKNYEGDGVVVGVVDMGFDVTHPTFYSKDYSSYRISRFWKQTGTGGTNPTGFNYGNEYTTEAAILAARTDNPNESHGSHVAGIAAGSGVADGVNDGKYRGVAPSSELVLVGSDGHDNKLLDGVSYIINYAKSVSKPCVINLSWGSHYGPHDGNSLKDLFMDGKVAQGVVIVGSSGNEADEPIHVTKKIQKDGSDALKTYMTPSGSITSIDGTGYFVSEVGQDKGFTISFSLRDTRTNTETSLGSTSTYPASSKTYTDLIEGTTVEVGTGIEAPHNRHTCVFSVKNSINNTTRRLVINITPITTEITVHGWVVNGSLMFSDLGLTGSTLVNGDNNTTCGELGGVGKNILSVGAFSTKNTWIALDGSSQSNGFETKIGEIASFSSKGPTVDNRIKPDITASGDMIISSVNSANTPKYGEKSILSVLKTRRNGTDYFYGSMQGTSMASPYVAGVIALWLEANPQLTTNDIKTILSQTARTDSPVSLGNTWGRGKIDAMEGIKEVIRTSSVQGIVAPRALILQNEGVLSIIGAQDNSLVQIYNTAGNCVLQKTLQEEHVPIDHLPNGIYLVKVGQEKMKFIK